MSSSASILQQTSRENELMLESAQAEVLQREMSVSFKTSAYMQYEGVKSTLLHTQIKLFNGATSQTATMKF